MCCCVLLQLHVAAAIGRSVVMQQSFVKVPHGPDTALLEFALALAHSTAGISGFHRHNVTDDLHDRLSMGMERASAKLVRGLQRLLYLPKLSAGLVGMNASEQQQQQQQLLRKLAGDGLPVNFTAGMSLINSGEKLLLEAEAAVSNAVQQPVGIMPLLWHFLTGLPLQRPSTATAGGGRRDTPLVPPLRMCLLLNESVCNISVSLTQDSWEDHESGSSTDDAANAAPAQQSFLIVAYNPLPWSYTSGIRVPVGDAMGFQVTDPLGAPVPSQEVPLVSQGRNSFWEASMNQGARKLTKKELALQVQVPALGHAVYKVVSDSLTSAASGLGDLSAEEGSVSAVSEEVKLALTDKARVLSNGLVQLLVQPAHPGIKQVLGGISCWQGCW
jgi:hypothetical protein